MKYTITRVTNPHADFVRLDAEDGSHYHIPERTWANQLRSRLDEKIESHEFIIVRKDIHGNGLVIPALKNTAKLKVGEAAYGDKLTIERYDNGYVIEKTGRLPKLYLTNEEMEYLKNNI